MRLHPILLAAAFIPAALGLCLSPAPAASARRNEIVVVVEQACPAVVNIHSERTVQGLTAEELFALAPSQNRINGMGTGIIIDPRGYIITNEHVVEDVHSIRVRLHDGTAASARVLARDNDADLALLKIDTNHPLPTIPLGTASDLMVGETVIAIGNAYGYADTVTVGIVSAVKRDVTLNKEISYKGLIQTDASINPGNSGGPLLNINGELIGVNVAIRAGAQNIGFAIPVDTMMHVAADLLSVRKRNGLWHGVVARDEVNAGGNEAGPGVETTTRTTSLVAPGSAALRRLVVERPEPNSPAARAGLKPGDVVAQVGDVRVGCALEMERALLDHAAGDRIPLVVTRAGKEEHVELVLQTAERSTAAPAELVWQKLGLRLTQVSGELVARANQQLHGGLAVMEVRPDSIASKAGIQRGDILVGLHQWEMLTLDNVAFVLNHPDLATFNPIRFYILRSGQVQRGWLQQVD